MNKKQKPSESNAPRLLSDDRVKAILEFWFTESSPKQRFARDIGFDKQIRERFGPWVDWALEGKLQRVSTHPRSVLAHILLLDQFTRNLYRDSPTMFAGDTAALALTLELVSAGGLRDFSPEEAQFALMPLMHTESLEFHQLAQPLFREFTSPAVCAQALRYLRIIEKHNRFPHRDKILGRNTFGNSRD